MVISEPSKVSLEERTTVTASLSSVIVVLTAVASKPRFSNAPVEPGFASDTDAMLFVIASFSR